MAPNDTNTFFQVVLLRVAACDQRGLIRIDDEVKPTIDNFGVCVEQLQSRAAAGCFLGLLLQHVKVDRLPMKFLHHHTRIGLEQAKGRVKSEQPLLHFVLRVLLHTPATLRAFMYELFRDSTVGVIDDLQTALLHEASKYKHERYLTTALFSLGVSGIGTDSWRHAFEQSLCECSESQKDAAAVASPSIAATTNSDTRIPCLVPEARDSVTDATQPPDAVLTPASLKIVETPQTDKERDVDTSIASAPDDAETILAEKEASAMIFDRRSQFRELGAAEVELGSALPELADKLYSKDVHFILELVQNADDNSYDVEATPTLNLVITDHEIRIENNEARAQFSL